ncbi:hypothetical protein RRG08_050421 [Elysia crispata]|uniref:Uncharacterized protein n=1 Tax=Elysia crispata TaxID=231223 RepID=A0AAE0ZLF8_9GAST|nr:hypothetical protein RRG08_050421 [Elysia crispata]
MDKPESNSQVHIEDPAQNRPSSSHVSPSQRKVIDTECGIDLTTNNVCANLSQSTAPVSFSQNTQEADTACTSNTSNCQIPTAGQKLIMAAKTGDLPALDRLLQQQQGGSKHFISQDHLNVSLLEACREGRKFIVQKLVRSGVEVNVRGYKRCTTPLHIAAEQGFVDIAAFLLDKDADVDACDGHGNSALILAVNRTGSSDMLNLLLVYEAKVDHQNSEGVTALMKAVEVMDIDAVKILILARSDLKQKNRLRETARDIAVRHGIVDVFDFLKSEKESQPRVYSADSGCTLTNAALHNRAEAVEILFDCRCLQPKVRCKDLHEDKEANQKMKFHAWRKLIDSICSDAKGNKELSGIKFELVKSFLRNGIREERAQQPYTCNFLSKESLSSALIDATQSGVLELVELLCKVKNIELNSFNRCQSALMKASEIGRLDLVKLLLKFGADPKTEIYRGEIALTSALRNGHIRCANALLQEYKPSEKKLQEMVQLVMRYCQLESLKFLSSQCNVDEISQSLVETGIRTGDSKIVQFLVDHGADINKPCRRGTPALLIALNTRKDCNMLDMVTLLVENGACVNRIPPNKTPLIVALENEYCHLDVIQYLLEKGADVNGDADHWSPTPLVAALNRYPPFSGNQFFGQSLLEVLLQAGADPNRREYDGSTALHIAMRMNDLGSIKQLLDAGADLEARDPYGFTPMLQAVRGEQVKVVKLLKEFGANMKAVDKKGKNAVLYSVTSFSGRKEKILKLVASDKDQVNLQLPDGQTPLILASKYGGARVIKILLEAGADPHKRNNQQKTALSGLVCSLRYTRFGNDVPCVKLLIKHNALLSLPKHYSHGLYLKIMADERELVQLMVTHGMAPMCVDFTNMKGSVGLPVNMKKISDSVWRNLSPLAAALTGNRLVIARYLVGNWFLTPADRVGSDQLKYIRNVHKRYRDSEIHNFLDEYMSQPMSLVQLSFVAVSAQLGETIGREERVRKTPLPTGLQDRLLFKIENCSMDFSGVVKDHRGMFFLIVNDNVIVKEALKNAKMSLRNTQL